MAVGDGSPGGIIYFWWSSGDTPCHGWVKGILVAPRQSALLGQPRVQVGQLDVLLPGSNSGANFSWLLVNQRSWGNRVFRWAS
ncbi:hypothetical protein AVEN_138725-1 [Araneus ventricosus]|uniref:Uncharacterized protein n=2 Tax=Araneus ventricosus TaxID=182803 RepID=A0A4Y2WK84_ARAVE|nr:hypothetical protein AVEN_138725-1 [Araneus ventricosus]